MSLRGEISAELTAREMQVAALIGQGLRNREIAVELGMSEGTAKLHVLHIMQKTGLTNRTQVALWQSR